MESKQAYARGTEDYFEEQLIPIRRLDSTTPPRPARSWIICCMCWLEGTALTCNTWLLQKYSVLPSLIGFLSSVCFFFFFLFLSIFWHFVSSPFFPAYIPGVLFCVASNPQRHLTKESQYSRLLYYLHENWHYKGYNLFWHKEQKFKWSFKL